MTLEQLRARLKALRTEAKAIVDGCEDGNLTEEQQAKFDGLMADAEGVQANIERMERLEGFDQSAGRQVDAGKPAAPAQTRDRVEDDPKRGFSSMADFGLAVHSACLPGGDFDKRLAVVGAPTNFHTEKGDSGYMVPPAMRDEIWRLTFAQNSLLDMVAPEPTMSNAVNIVTDETTPWGATGVQASWAAEGSQFDASKLETKGVQVKLHKLFAFVTATDELIEDAPRLNARLTQGAAEAINFKASAGIFDGTGVGQPEGLMNSGAKVTVAKESGQAANTVVAANVAKMFSRAILTGMGNIAWLVNQDVLPQLMTMTIGDQPIWTPPTTGFQNAPGGFLLGRPVMFNDHSETLGTEGDISLFNAAGYYAANKASGIDFASSIHLYFDYDIQAFRWTFRIGGRTYMSAPLAPNKGSSTRSHFVTLATRS